MVTVRTAACAEASTARVLLLASRNGRNLPRAQPIGRAIEIERIMPRGVAYDGPPRVEAEKTTQRALPIRVERRLFFRISDYFTTTRGTLRALSTTITIAPR